MPFPRRLTSNRGNWVDPQGNPTEYELPVDDPNPIIKLIPVRSPYCKKWLRVYKKSMSHTSSVCFQSCLTLKPHGTHACASEMSGGIRMNINVCFKEVPYDILC